MSDTTDTTPPAPAKSEGPTIEVVDITDAEAAFPARVVGHLLPLWEKIPEEFKGGNEWTEIVARWFFRGLPKGTEFVAKEGIDSTKAIRHVSACIGSFEPRHEHKEAGCGYLLSEFFERVEIPS